MDFDKQIRSLLTEQNWESLADLLNERLDSIKAQLSSNMSAKEKDVFIQEQLNKDTEYLKHVVAQKKEVEQQLLTLKQGKKVSQLYRQYP